MVSFVNFARISRLCVGLHLGTLHGYFFHQDFWPNLNFPLECQVTLVLKFILLLSLTALIANLDLTTLLLYKRVLLSGS